MRSQHLFLVMLMAATLSSCNQAEPDVTIGPALLNPHTRSKTVHEILHRNPDVSFFAKGDLATFEQEVDEIHVLPYPAVGKAAGYVVNLRSKITADGLPLTAHRHDPYARGRLYVGRERALVPLRDHSAFLIRPNGSIPDLAYFVSLDGAIVADLNADGEPEHLKQTSVSHPFNRENEEGAELRMHVVKITQAREPFGAGPEFSFNPRVAHGSPIEWWNWWAEDANGDGVFSVHFGPVRSGKAQSVVTLEWNATARAWEAKGILAETPCRYAPLSPELPSSARTKSAEEDLRDAIAKNVIAVPKAGSKPKEESPFQPWYSEIPIEQLSGAYEKQTLAGKSPATLFATMTERRMLHQHLRPFWLKEFNLPPALADKPQELARKIYAGIAKPDGGPLAFDTLDGANPPDAGDVMLYHFPSRGCFTPYEAHVTHLRCEQNGSFVSVSSVFAENTSRVPLVEYKPAFEFRRIALSVEEARAFLQTAWWLRRIQVWPSNSSRDAGLNLRSFYDEDHAIFRVVAGADRWEERRFHWDEATRAIDAGTWLFRVLLPEVLGKRWDTESFGSFPMAGKLSDAQQTRLRDRARQVLEDFIVAPHAPEAAKVALEAIEENHWEDLRPLVEAAAKKIPAPTAKERRLAVIEEELARGLRKHGKDQAGDHAIAVRLSARQKTAKTNDASLAIPGLTEDLVIPGAPPARVYSKEELDRFAPLDALYAEKQRIWLSESEDAFKELRMLSERAAKQLAAQDNLSALEQAARTTRWPMDPSVRRLALLDPARAASVFEARASAEWDNDPRAFAESLAILRGKAGQPDSSMEALALGLRPAKREDVPLLFQFQLGTGHIDFRAFDGVVRSLVPPSEPMRHAWPELDAGLLKLHQTTYKDVDTVTAALIRRKVLTDWEEKMAIFPRSLLAFAAPDRFRERLKQHLVELLADPKADPDPIARAAWLCDLRELAPQLQPRATSRMEDLENWGAGARRHEVRWVLHVWDEKDPATRAQLLISYAVGSAFHPSETPEAWERLLSQVGAALAEASPEARADVFAFLQWLKTEGAARRLDEPQRVTPEQVLAALESSLAP
jgi:hypothetical protein